MRIKAQTFNRLAMFGAIVGVLISSSSYAATTKTVTTQVTDEQVQNANHADPYEKFNRAMFAFNDHLDHYALKPIAKLYNAIIPKPLNQGIHNFFNNINELPTIANDILQFQFRYMANDMWRFGVNTTVGIGGLFDIASRINLTHHTTDFGLTLARWGYQQSNYLVLPFYGPNTFRDGLGIPVDYFAFSVYPYIHSDELRYGLYGLSVVDKRAQLLQYENVVDQVAVDRYVFVREAYLQNRNYQIENGGNNNDFTNEKPVATAGGDNDFTNEKPVATVG